MVRLSTQVFAATAPPVLEQSEPRISARFETVLWLVRSFVSFWSFEFHGDSQIGNGHRTKWQFCITSGPWRALP